MGREQAELFKWQQAVLRAALQDNLARLEHTINAYLKLDPQCDINQIKRGIDQENLLHHVIRENKKARLLVVNMLVDRYKMDPCSLNAKGETPFYIASIKNDKEVMKYLYEAKPQCCHIPDKWGFLPADVAYKYNNQTALQFLKETCDQTPNIVHKQRALASARKKQSYSDCIQASSALLELAGAKPPSNQRRLFPARQRRSSLLCRKPPVKRVRSSGHSLFDEATIKEATQQVEQAMQEAFRQPFNNK